MATIPVQEAAGELVADLRRDVSGDVRFDTFSRTLYSTDASIYQMMPVGVVIPRNVEDIIAAVEVAARHGVPVLPRGTGSSLAGQTVNTALVIDFSRHLDGMLEVNADERWARVQPGMVRDTFNRQLVPLGLHFGPDPASSERASFGGMVGNNSSGAHSILYGMTADHVQAADVILADGTPVTLNALNETQLAARLEREGFEGDIYRGVHALVNRHHEAIHSGYPKVWRRSSGYNLDRMVNDEPFNLADLLVGSEGTLAVMTSIKVGLVPLPPRTALLVIHFDRLPDALSATPRILETHPSAVELMDKFLLDMTRSVPTYARELGFVEGDPEALLVVEYYGDSQAELNSKLDKLQDILRREKIGGATLRALDAVDIARVWKVRKVGLGLLMGIKGDYKPIPFIEDAAVPVEHLADYIRQVDELCSSHDTRAAYYAHASAGVIHVRPLVNLKNAEGVARMRAIAEGSFELVGGYGGAISGEHGDGLVRSEFNELLFGPQLYGAFRELKGIFDPRNLMNPGKIVDAPAMTTHLRYGPDYRAEFPPTIFAFEAEQGFDRAVELCNGAGVCRRLESGTMCPSFQATREEEHSTRGRANLLRAGMAGIIPVEQLTGPRMFEALDLCLECKACKGECPSGVDMAKLKAEWLHRYYAEHGVPLRARLFGNIHTLSKIGSAFAPFSNWALRLGVTHWLMQKVLGIHQRRTLPNFARLPFDRWFKRRAVPNGNTGRPQVVLFHDTYMTYNDPQIGIAATEVLEAAGYEVLLAEGRKCCGRPMISKGLLPQAQANAAHNVALLADYARRGLPIIGCEPSCLLTLRDDYPDLVPGEDARLVADAALTFEEFVAREAAAGTFVFALPEADAEAAQKLLLHGHCYQKTLVGTGPALAALGLPPGYEVKEISSGCCGMAGSFGYEVEHYDLSLQIGELSLLPAVRQAGTDVEIVAAGISCRQQIAHGTDRRAKHPAVVLYEAMEQNGSEASNGDTI